MLLTEDKMKKELDTSELHYRTLIKEMPNGFALHEVICDDIGHPINYRFLEINSAFEQLTSLTAEQVIGKTVLEVLPDLEKFWIDTYGQVALHRQTIHFQKFSVELKRHFDVLAFSPAKKQFAVVITDITEQKRAESALSNSEEIFRRTFDQSPIGAAMVGLDYRFTKVNQEFCRITGYSADELVGLSFADITHTDDVDLDMQQACELIQGKIDQYQMDKRYIRKDRKPIWVRLSVRLIRDTQNEPLYFLPMIEDINEHKKLIKEKDISLKLLQIINEDSDLEKLSESLLCFLKSWLKIDAIGIRLKKGEDFPYFKTYGFSQEFVRRESSLCCPDRKVKIVSEGENQPYLECLCGYVIGNGRDHSLPFFTPKGSFYTNSTTMLLEQSADFQMPENMRQHCLEAGYESVLLIPLRTGGNTVGLLQLNDTNKNRFPPDLVSVIERLAEYISVAVVQRLAEECLLVKQTELEEMNAALKVLLRTREKDLLEHDRGILANIRQLVLPSIERIRAGSLSVQQKAQLNILQGNLENISSPFAKHMSASHIALTPTLIQIAKLIKNGLSNKEIAETRGISIKTVETYRKRIRERLNLQNSKINLRTHLMNMT